MQAAEKKAEEEKKERELKVRGQFVIAARWGSLPLARSIVQRRSVPPSLSDRAVPLCSLPDRALSPLLQRGVIRRGLQAAAKAANEELLENQEVRTTPTLLCCFERALRRR